MTLLQQVRHDRFRAADPVLTVRRLMNGEPVTMDLYRSRKEKLDLLDEALNSFDGNVITAVSVGGSSGILGYARKFFF